MRKNNEESFPFHSFDTVSSNKAIKVKANVSLFLTKHHAIKPY
jgi:hypothetical protein